MPALSAVESQRTLTVSKIAADNAEGFAKLINTSPAVASKKLKRFTKALLNRMEMGDEQTFPIASTTARKSFVIRKTGYEEFVITVIVQAPKRRRTRR